MTELHHFTYWKNRCSDSGIIMMSLLYSSLPVPRKAWTLQHLPAVLSKVLSCWRSPSSVGHGPIKSGRASFPPGNTTESRREWGLNEISKYLTLKRSWKSQKIMNRKIFLLIFYENTKCWEIQVWPLVGKIPWRRKRQPTAVSLSGESHGQENPPGYNPWGLQKSWTWLWLSTHPRIITKATMSMCTLACISIYLHCALCVHVLMFH